MEERHASEGSVGSRDNHSRVPSQTLKLVLQKRMRKHRNRDNLEMQGDLHATSSMGEWTISNWLEDSYQSDRDQELKTYAIKWESWNQKLEGDTEEGPLRGLIMRIA